MPFAKIDPVNLRYQIMGAAGPVLALTPGGSGEPLPPETCA
jgi:hypothetical protein